MVKRYRYTKIITEQVASRIFTNQYIFNCESAGRVGPFNKEKVRCQPQWPGEYKDSGGMSSAAGEVTGHQPLAEFPAASRMLL